MQTQKVLILLLSLMVCSITMGYSEVVVKDLSATILQTNIETYPETVPEDSIDVVDEINRLVRLRTELTQARHDALLCTSREKSARGDVEYLEECLVDKEEMVALETGQVPFDTLEVMKDEVKDFRVYVKRAKREHRWANQARQEAMARLAELEGMVIDLETWLLTQGIELPSEPQENWNRKARLAYQRLNRNKQQDQEPGYAYTPIHQPSGLYLLRVRPPQPPEIPAGEPITARQILFTEKHSTSKEEMYLYATVELRQIDDLYFLDLEVHFDSELTASIYGKLERGSIMRVRLDNGDQLSLINLIAHTGEQQPATGEVVISGRYLIEQPQLERLKSVPLDRIRLYWRGGYEDYQIELSDFFMEELALLN